MEVCQNVSLKELTTFGIGGAAQYFCEVRSIAELVEASAWAKERNLPLKILAGGSNVLIADEGVSGLVVHNQIAGQEVRTDGDTIFLKVGAGVVFDEVVQEAVQERWWGLENLSCIPGSVGATPIQNVGAYGVEVKDVVASVDVYDTETETTGTFKRDECAFAYRDSRFKRAEGKRYVVTHVTYALSTTPRPVLHYRDLATWSADRPTPTLAEIRTAVCAIRAGKFPDWHQLGTAGSFFKNPIVSAEAWQKLALKYPELPGHPASNGAVKVPLGWILEHVLNARGVREGNVGTYEGQALVLVNHGGATAHDVGAFADALAKKVFDATGMHIEREVTTFA